MTGRLCPPGRLSLVSRPLLCGLEGRVGGQTDASWDPGFPAYTSTSGMCHQPGVWLCFLPPSTFTGPFNTFPNTAHHHLHRTGRPASRSVHSFPCARHVPDTERTTRHHPNNPQAGDPFRVWVRRWRGMRQRARVPQPSERGDRGQPGFSLQSQRSPLPTPHPAPSTRSQPWLGSGIPRNTVKNSPLEMLIQFVGAGTQVRVLEKNPEDLNM